MDDVIRRVYTWDAPGVCGVSVDRDRARAALRSALDTAPAGTTGELWANVFTDADYERDRLLGRAARTPDGVEWVETAAVGAPGGRPAAVHTGAGVPELPPCSGAPGPQDAA